MTCRDWLLANHYKDVALLIDNAIAKMEARGSKQRRNWWDILSGAVDGKPCVREGIEFPVLRTAQIRQGKPITKNAIALDDHEEPPEIVTTGRWKKKKLSIRARALVKNRSDPEKSEPLNRRRVS
jgi:hypothetical protein